MSKKLAFDSTAVLLRAIDIITAGRLPPKHSDHGEWCPYCAIALAKGQLDDEHGTGLDLGEVMLQTFVFGLSPVASDEPLLTARQRVGSVEKPYTQTGTLAALRDALTTPWVDS